MNTNNDSSHVRPESQSEISSIKPHALIIEDEPQIRRFVRMALENEGWQVYESATFQRGLIDVGTRKPDMVVLDLGLPDGDGIDLIREIRQWTSVPIIVLSARTHEAEKIKALDSGADDYLTKPFGIGELQARVRATLRRQRNSLMKNADIVHFGDVMVHLPNRLVTKAKVIVHLTPIEFKLLSILIQHAEKVVTNLQLLRQVWGPSHAEDGHYLRIYIRSLRQKLEDDPAQPQYLLTETAVGYRLMLDNGLDK